MIDWVFLKEGFPRQSYNMSNWYMQPGFNSAIFYGKNSVTHRKPKKWYFMPE